MEMMKDKNFNFEQDIDFEAIAKHIRNNILPRYGEKAANEATPPLFFSDAEDLMPTEIEMCIKILNIWEIDRYYEELDDLVENNILVPSKKYIQRTLTGKILRLIPAGVTILSIGINGNVARRFTLALGHAMSELSQLFIQSVRDGKDVEIMDVFTKDAIEDLMDDYLVEYKKTVLN